MTDAHKLSLKHYTSTGKRGFKEFVSNCGGAYAASMKLNVPTFFIEQILRDEPVPDHILDRIEQAVGPLRIREVASGFSSDTSQPKSRNGPKADDYTHIAQHRFKEFVSNCGGAYAASAKLDVPTFFIEQILRDEPVPDRILDRIEEAVGPLRIHRHASRPSNHGNSQGNSGNRPKAETEPEISVEEFVRNSGGLIPASHRLGMSLGTIQKILSGVPISERKIKKMLDRMRAIADLPNRIKQIIKSDSDLLHLSLKSGITEAALRDICEGKPVTRPIREKLEAALGPPKTIDLPEKPSSGIDRWRTIHALYKQLGTLEAVGKQVGLTRERVRQILNKGKNSGLFEYNPYGYPFVSKEKLIEDCKKAPSLAVVARLNNISTAYLDKLFTAYSINEEDLTTYRFEARRVRCIEQFSSFAEHIGHPPNTTELQRTGKGRALYNRITRYWGSIDNFRAQLNIPKPPHRRPHWLDSWRQIALIKRMQHLDTLRDCMSGIAPVGLAELCQKTNFGPNRVRRLLALLTATGEVNRIGQKYLLVPTEVIK